MMIIGDNIAKLVDLFNKRGVNLYHACQYKDFNAYLTIGGIPSRKVLEDSGQEFTAFDTDKVDRNNGVWDKVFVNLSDFGKGFAKGNGATPNPYGPILLVIDPTSLLQAQDVAITLRSAGAYDFNRESESLSSIEKVDQLFKHPTSSEKYLLNYVKYKEELQNEFNSPKAVNPEINCTFSQGFIPCNYIKKIVVDPYKIDETLLQNHVYESMKANNFVCEMDKRKCERFLLYTEIGNFLMDEIPAFQEMCPGSNYSGEIVMWIDQMKVFNIEYQFKRFAKYLREGTLFPILNSLSEKYP